MMFSTCAVSCTPSAAVGSSMMMSFEAKVAVRAIATHCRWPPDMCRMVLPRLGIFTPVRSSASLVASRIALAVEDRERPEVEQDLLAPEEEVGRHVEVVGQRQRLEHRLDAGLAGLERPGEVHLLAVEPDLAAGRAARRR